MAKIAGCNSTPELPSHGDGTGDGDSNGNGSGDGDADFNIDGPGGQSDGGAFGGDGDRPVCEKTSSETELTPIFLAFAIDVPGSMGQYVPPNGRPSGYSEKIPRGN